MNSNIIALLDELLNQRTQFYCQVLKVVDSEYCNNLCSKLADEYLLDKHKYETKILEQSNISFERRKDILSSIINARTKYYGNNAPLNRSLDLAHYYHSFVYTKDNIFELLKRQSRPESKLKKICKYLINGKVRAFRNAFAHGNWYIDGSDSDTFGYYYSAKVDSNGSQNKEVKNYFASIEEVFNWSILSLAISYIVYYTDYS